MNNSDKKQERNISTVNKGGDNDSSSSQGAGAGAGAGSDAIQAKPLEVKVSGNNFDKAIRTFRALVQKERILSIYKEKQTYEKSSDKKRRKKNEAKRKLHDIDNKEGNKNKFD